MIKIQENELENEQKSQHAWIQSYRYNRKTLKTNQETYVKPTIKKKSKSTYGIMEYKISENGLR